MKTTLKNLLITISSLSITGAVLTVILLIFGFRPFILMTSSMEPDFKRGSLVIIDTKVKPGDLKIGDAVAYRAPNGTFIMHQLVAENTLKGTANPDAEYVILTEANLVGRSFYSVSIPGLGYMIQKIQQFSWIMWIIILALLFLSCLPFASDKSYKEILHKESFNER